MRQIFLKMIPILLVIAFMQAVDGQDETTAAAADAAPTEAADGAASEEGGDTSEAATEGEPDVEPEVTETEPEPEPEDHSMPTKGTTKAAASSIAPAKICLALFGMTFYAAKNMYYL